MKIGIDSYCYHRYFGEIKDGQPQPPARWQISDFLKKAYELGADGVSLESCYFPGFEADYLKKLKGELNDYGMEPVFAWGHPTGLEGGQNTAAYEEMLRCFEYAGTLGASVMRVVGSSYRQYREPHGPMLERLAGMFSSAVGIAEKYNIRMAVENHQDFNSDEILWLVQKVNSPFLGVTLDTGNLVRVNDDPVRGAQKLSGYVFATHLKDLRVQVQAGSPGNAGKVYASVPIGDGLVDNLGVVRVLRENGYRGMLTVEMDTLHSDYHNDEDYAVAKSIRAMRKIVASTG